MALKDGMFAIAKVLKVIAIGLGGLFFLGALYSAFFTGGNFGDAFFMMLGGLFIFFLFWTPAWVIKKFIQ